MHRIRHVLCCVGMCAALMAACSGQARSAAVEPFRLLDHLAGDWILTGTIAGKQTTHDVEASWVLNREYLRLHEVSREKTASGAPAYEAIVFIGWDNKAHQYTCLWLDSTSGDGLSAQTIARATPAENSIPFLFTISPSEFLHTTFTYDSTADSWRWLIDDEAKGKTDRFADVKLLRAPSATKFGSSR